MDAALADTLTKEVMAIGRVGRGFPLYLEPPPGATVIPAREYFAHEGFLETCRRSASVFDPTNPSLDPRGGAARIARSYAGGATMAALLPLLHGVGFEITLDRCLAIIQDEQPQGMVLDLDGLEPLLAADRPTTWPVRGTTLPDIATVRERVLRAMFTGNLVPAFERVRSEVRLSWSNLWCSTAEMIDLLYHGARRYHVADPRIIDADRAAVLDASEAPGIPGANPLAGMITYEQLQDFPEPVPLRKICCVRYLMDDRPGNYCRNCPVIPAEQRREVWLSIPQFREQAGLTD